MVNNFYKALVDDLLTFQKPLITDDNWLKMVPDKAVISD